MPRLDLQYRNRDITHMLTALRVQAATLATQLSMIEARCSIHPPEEIFSDPKIRDELTNISLTANNLSGEATTVWKRTR